MARSGKIRTYEVINSLTSNPVHCVDLFTLPIILLGSKVLRLHPSLELMPMRVYDGGGVGTHGWGGVGHNVLKWVCSEEKPKNRVFEGIEVIGEVS